MRWTPSTTWASRNTPSRSTARPRRRPASTTRSSRGDVRDADLVSELVADADYVYHQAAKAGVRPSVEAPREYDAVNVNGTLNLLDAARETTSSGS